MSVSSQAQQSQGELETTETCSLMNAFVCKARSGRTIIKEGYLIVLKGVPGVICEDCRDVVLSKQRSGRRFSRTAP